MGIGLSIERSKPGRRETRRRRRRRVFGARSRRGAQLVDDGRRRVVVRFSSDEFRRWTHRCVRGTVKPAYEAFVSPSFVVSRRADETRARGTRESIINHHPLSLHGPAPLLHDEPAPERFPAPFPSPLFVHDRVRRVAQRHPRQSSQERTRIVVEVEPFLRGTVSRLSRGRGRGFDRCRRRRRCRRSRALGRDARSRHRPRSTSECEASDWFPSRGARARRGRDESAARMRDDARGHSGDVDVEDSVGDDGDGTTRALRVGASEVYSESVGETERRRRDQSARLENSHASHWAALAGNARAITGDAPR